MERSEAIKNQIGCPIKEDLEAAASIRSDQEQQETIRRMKEGSGATSGASRCDQEQVRPNRAVHESLTSRGSDLEHQGAIRNIKERTGATKRQNGIVHQKKIWRRGDQGDQEHSGAIRSDAKHKGMIRSIRERSGA